MNTKLGRFSFIDHPIKIHYPPLYFDYLNLTFEGHSSRFYLPLRNDMIPYSSEVSSPSVFSDLPWRADYVSFIPVMQGW